MNSATTYPGTLYDYTAVEDRIRTATVANQPEPRFPVFIASTYDEAKDLADERHEATASKEGQS